MTDLRAYAHTLLDAGYTPLPVRPDGSKAPAVAWRDFQHAKPTHDQIDAWFHDGITGIGVLTGAASGNLEMIELEGRAVTAGMRQKLEQLLADHDATDLWRRITAGPVHVTPSGGMHWHYRVTDGSARGNTKLARTADRDVLIETRGEGGFTVIAPSAGTTHPTGSAWMPLNPGATLETDVAEITSDERDQLHAICTLLDEQAPEPTPEPRPLRAVGDSDTLRPGDDYNQRATWDDVLTPHGWTRVRGGNGFTSWRKPDKHGPGISATTGRNDADNLYVFSTATEFEPERPYSKFSAYTLLEHGGDYRAAARALAAQGYGNSTSQNDTTALLRLVHPNPTFQPPITDGSSAIDTATAPARVTEHEQTLTDVGNAHLLVAEHGDVIRYVPKRGQWLTWTGHRWLWDDAGSVIERAKTTVLAIDPDDDTTIAKHRTRSLSRRSIEAMVALARTDPAITVDISELDAHPYALNTPAGVVDLRTGRTTPPRPTDLHTRSTTTAPDTTCPTPRWNAFLEQTFDGNPDLAPFLQRLLGYSATGAVTHHVLPFLHGPGGNGKSVLLDVIRSLLGDYAAATPTKFLMANQQQHETEIARLAGLRFVICSEVNQDDRFDEAKVKLLTGGDAITARFMRQDHFTFEPTHHLWLMGNHQPKVTSGGESFWRRLRMVAFANVVPDNQKIEDLAQRLIVDEGPGILAWVVAGARDALANGLQTPGSVLEATRTYADEEDALARFVADRIHLGGGDIVRADTSVVRRAYASWCSEQGEREVSPQVFGRELRTRFGVTQKRAHGKRFYVGMALIADDDTDGGGWQDR